MGLLGVMRTLGSRPIVRDTGWQFVGNSARIGLQSIAFVLIARVLGASELGAFSAILAVVLMLSPFVDYGAYGLIVQDVTSGIPTSRAVGNSLILTTLALPLALMVVAFLKDLLLGHQSWQIVLPLAVTAFVGIKLYNVCRAVLVAHRLMFNGAMLEILNGTSYLAAVLAAMFLDAGLEEWVWIYCIHSLTVGILGLILICIKWGIPDWSIGEVIKRFRLGIHFAIGGAVNTAYNDLDKTMLARLSTLEATGVYTAAHRFTSMLMVPLMAFVSALYPRMFAAGRTGLCSARAIARRAVPVALAYSALAGVAVWWGAPIIVDLLGEDFADGVPALRMFTLLLVIQAVAVLFADALSGSGYQHIRSSSQVLALCLNVALNLVAIPRYGWAGAAMVAIVTQVCLLLLFVIRPMQRRRTFAICARLRLTMSE